MGAAETWQLLVNVKLVANDHMGYVGEFATRCLPSRVLSALSNGSERSRTPGNVATGRKTLSRPCQLRKTTRLTTKTYRPLHSRQRYEPASGLISSLLFFPVGLLQHDRRPSPLESPISAKVSGLDVAAGKPRFPVPSRSGSSTSRQPLVGMSPRCVPFLYCSRFS